MVWCTPPGMYVPSAACTQAQYCTFLHREVGPTRRVGQRTDTTPPPGDRACGRSCVRQWLLGDHDWSNQAFGRWSRILFGLTVDASARWFGVRHANMEESLTKLRDPRQRAVASNPYQECIVQALATQAGCCRCPHAPDSAADNNCCTVRHLTLQRVPQLSVRTMSCPWPMSMAPRVPHGSKKTCNATQDCLLVCWSRRSLQLLLASRRKAPPLSHATRSRLCSAPGQKSHGSEVAASPLHIPVPWQRFKQGVGAPVRHKT